MDSSSANNTAHEPSTEISAIIPLGPQENEWEGLLIYGCIRDSEVINEMDIGVRALSTCPVKSIKKDHGDVNQVVKFASVELVPGNYVYVDGDGILISREKLDF